MRSLVSTALLETGGILYLSATPPKTIPGKFVETANAANRVCGGLELLGGAALQRCGQELAGTRASAPAVTLRDEKTMPPATPSALPPTPATPPQSYPTTPQPHPHAKS